MFPKKPTKYVSVDEAVRKLRHYCGYQERSHQEARYKLLHLGMRGDDVEDIMALLIQEGYLDEERYARSFARGKLRNNGWGINKIIQALKQKKISDYNLRMAREEIANEEYDAILYQLLLKKKARLTGQSTLEMRQKLFKYAYAKGFETTTINKQLTQILDN